MACELNYEDIESISLTCQPTSGGIASIEYGDFYDTNPLPSMTPLLFDVNDKQTKFDEVLTNNENGTTVVAQTLTVFVAGIDADTHATLDALCNPNVRLRVRFVAVAGGGQLIEMGKEFGTTLSEVSIATGASAGDAEGYTLTFTAEEKELALPA